MDITKRYIATRTPIYGFRLGFIDGFMATLILFRNISQKTDVRVYQQQDFGNPYDIGFLSGVGCFSLLELFLVLVFISILVG